MRPALYSSGAWRWVAKCRNSELKPRRVVVDVAAPRSLLTTSSRKEWRVWTNYESADALAEQAQHTSTHIADIVRSLQEPRVAGLQLSSATVAQSQHNEVTKPDLEDCVFVPASGVWLVEAKRGRLDASRSWDTAERSAGASQPRVLVQRRGRHGSATFWTHPKC